MALIPLLVSLVKRLVENSRLINKSREEGSTKTAGYGSFPRRVKLPKVERSRDAVKWTLRNEQRVLMPYRMATPHKLETNGV